MPLWKDGGFVADDWRIVGDDEPVSGEEKAIVTLARWRTGRDALSVRSGRIGLLIAPGETWLDVVTDLPRFPVIALTIPKFADGRALSMARVLRERDGYRGEVRVVGAYIVDQMPQMMRVGIDAFATDDPVLIRALERGDWPDVPHYLQPAFEHGTEAPAGARPWARRKLTKGQ